MHLHFTETEHTQTQNIAVTDIIRQLGAEAEGAAEHPKTSTKSVIQIEDSEDFSEQSMPICKIQGKTICFNVLSFLN